MTDEKLDRHQVAIDWVKYEGDLLWQVFGAFLLAHTVFVAFLLQAVLDKNLPADHPSGFWAGLMGLVLCLPWFSAYLRSSKYYEFRIAQAKESEPHDWEILRGAGEDFAEGKPVTIGGKTFQHTLLAHKLRTRLAVPFMIIVFAVVYGAILVASGPWW